MFFWKKTDIRTDQARHDVLLQCQYTTNLFMMQKKVMVFKLFWSAILETEK